MLHLALTQTMQIGIVVRDLDAAMRTYTGDFGIRPWQVYEFNPGHAKNLANTASR